MTERTPGSSRHLERVAGAVVLAVHAGVVLFSLWCPLLLLGSTFVGDDGRLDVSAWRNVSGDLDRWLVLIGNTGLALATALAVSIPVGTALGAILFRTDAWLRGPVLALFLFVAVIPLYVTNSGVLALFGPEFLAGSPVALGAIHGAAHLPVVLLVVGLALRSAPRALEESALVDGAGAFGTFVRVTLRAALGGMGAAAVLVGLWVTTDYSASDVLLVRTFAEETYTQFQSKGRPEEATLVSLPLLVIFAAIIGLFGRSWLRRDRPAAGSERPLVFRSRGWRLPHSLAAACAALGLAGAPAAFLVGKLETSKGFGHYVRVFLPEIWTSLWTGLAAGLICAVLAVGIAWYAVRRRFRGLIVSYVALLLAFPAPLLGIALIRVFNRPGLLGEIYDEPVMLVIAYTCRFLPVAVVVLVPWVAAVPAECEESARLDGCGDLGVWRRIVLPLSLPGMLLALFVVLALSIGELPCSHLVRPPGSFTVGVTYFSKIHYSIYGDAAALCLLALLCVGVPWLAIVFLYRGALFAKS